jgi:uncharacterized lipoprotein YddW (UPF0748 family)
MKFVVLIGIIALVACLGAASAWAERPRLAGSRAIMDEGVEWALSRDAIETRLRRISEAGFNVYIPCVWHGAGTRYSSRVAPPETVLQDAISAGFDPLAYLIQRAHELGIEVHPWFTVTLRQREFLKEFYDDGTPSQAFDIQNPEFQSFIGNLMLDVVARYNVDGINLDYVRSMGFCQSPACEAGYERMTGGDLDRDLLIRGVSDKVRRRLEQWNGAAVSAIVQRVATEARKSKPHIVLSADGKPDDAQPRLEGRDLIGWLNAGWVDVVYFTDYGPTLDVERFNRLRAQLKEPNALGRMVGNYEKRGTVGWPRKAELVSELVASTVTHWPDNPVGVYLYRQLDDAQIQALHQGPFSAKATPSGPRPTSER